MFLGVFDVCTFANRHKDNFCFSVLKVGSPGNVLYQTGLKELWCHVPVNNRGAKRGVGNYTVSQYAQPPEGMQGNPEFPSSVHLKKFQEQR